MVAVAYLDHHLRRKTCFIISTFKIERIRFILFVDELSFSDTSPLPLPGSGGKFRGSFLIDDAITLEDKIIFCNKNSI